MDISLWVDQIVNGLVLGNIYALLAAGLALIFGVAHLINFAHGSIYMAGSYAGWFCVVKLGAPLWIALPAAALAGAVIGLIVERLAVRPFRKSARVAPLLATLGAGMILDSIAELIFSPNPQAFPAIVPADRFSIGGVSVGLLDLVILGVSLASATGLFTILKWTKLGRAIRAAAQDAEAAEQMGVRVGMVNSAAFALASALGALAGVLVGLYYNFLSPSMGFQAGIKGFVACVLGGLGNIPAAMAGGLVLGVGESLGVGIFGSSARNLIAYAFLLLALFFRPNGLFGGKNRLPRETLTGTFLPQGKVLKIPLWAGAAIVLAGFLLPVFVQDGYILQILTGGWIMALFALSLTLVSGTAGIMSLGHAGLMAIGAYTSGLLTLKTDIPFEAAFISAGLVSALIATILVSPALKLKGHYVSIATLGIGEIVNQVILNWDWLTQGAMGLPGIPPPRLFGAEIVTTNSFYYLSFGVLVVCGLAVAAIMRSPLGRTLRAVREDETAAQSMGIQPRSYKGLAFGVSAFFAGLAGALTAHLYTYISHDTFGSSLSILGLTMVILGGLGNVWGAVLGALVLSVMPEFLRFAAEYRPLIYGLVLLLALRFRPQGLLGSR